MHMWMKHLTNFVSVTSWKTEESRFKLHTVTEVPTNLFITVVALVDIDMKAFFINQLLLAGGA